MAYSWEKFISASELDLSHLDELDLVFPSFKPDSLGLFASRLEMCPRPLRFLRLTAYQLKPLSKYSESLWVSCSYEGGVPSFHLFDRIWGKLNQSANELVELHLCGCFGQYLSDATLSNLFRFDCPKLQVLDVSGNNFGGDNARFLIPLLLSCASTLTTLRMAGCKLNKVGLKSFKEAGVCLSALEELWIFCNDLRDSIPHLVSVLHPCATKLRILLMAGCGLNDFDLSVLATQLEFPSLEELWLTANKIGEDGFARLLPLLGKMPKLKELGMGDCGLTNTCIEMLSEAQLLFPHLTGLSLTSNKIDSKGMKHLLPLLKACSKSLLVLGLGYCGLDRRWTLLLKEENIHFPKLQVFYLQGNPIGPEGFINFFPMLRSCSESLQKLNLSNCGIDSACLALLEIQDINFKSLATLVLHGNRLTNFPPLSVFSGLTSLDVSTNTISMLPPCIETETSLLSLDVGNNKLIIPPQAICTSNSKNHLADIKSYFKGIRENGSSECMLLRFKLVVLGNAMAGKTSLIQSLISGGKMFADPSARTRLVDTRLLSLPKGEKSSGMMLFDVLDFAGQDSCRVAQQLFLQSSSMSSRSVFLIVVPMDADPRVEFVEPWLVLLMSHSPDFQFLKLVVVATKADVCSEEELDTRAGALKTILSSLMKKYFKDLDQVPNPPVEIVCAAKASDRDKLCNRLKLSVQAMVSATELLPLSWVGLLEFLDSVRHSCHPLRFQFACSVDTLMGIVSSKFKFSSSAELRTALAFIHSLGVVFYFGNSSQLCDTVFLHPQWVADVLKSFIRHDLAQIERLDVSKAPYTAGSIQFMMDMADLRERGLLHHRLLPSLLWLRIMELRAELHGSLKEVL